MTQAKTRLLGSVVGAALLVAGCTTTPSLTGEPGRTGESGSSSPTAQPSVAIPVRSTSTSPTTSTPTQLPTTSSARVTRPTVPAESDGPSASGTTQPSGLPTATVTGTGGDGVPQGTATFGQTFRFPSGLQVMVTRPVTFTPSAGVTAVEGMTYAWVMVTLSNASSRPIDTGLVGHDASAGGTEATRIYDRAHQINPAGQTPGELAPGATRTYRVGFTHRRGLALVVRTAYGWDGQVIHT